MDIESLWWEAFGDSYGIEFEKACFAGDYDLLDKDTQIIGALMKLQLDMYNGGFIQFFCNWGYPAYLFALEGLDKINAAREKDILLRAYATIEKYSDDDRIQALWDIAAVLTDEESAILDRLDAEFCDEATGVVEKMPAVYGNKPVA